MEGVIIIKKRNRTNYFTADTYDALCMDIAGANKEPAVKGGVIVSHSKGQGGRLSTFILDVLASNGVPRTKIKKYGKYNSSNKKWHFLFDSNETAYDAMEIINKMSVPDKINRSKVRQNGTAETEQGLTVDVDVVTGENGELQLKEGTSYIPVNQTQTAQATTTGTGVNWLLIGGIVLAAAVGVFAYMKLKKKK